MSRRERRVNDHPKIGLRKLLAVPAALAVGLTSLMGLGASAAYAAPAPAVVILSPEDGDAPSSRTVEINGVGADGATVTLFDINGDIAPGTESTVVENNTWSAIAEFPADADTTQTIVAVQSFDGVADSSDEVTFVLPAAVPGVVIMTPEDDATVPSRTVAIEGAGANGATVTLFDANGDVLPGTEPTVIENNTWSVVAEFATDAATSQTIVAVQSFDSVVDSTDEVTITLPAAVPGIVIMTPEDGATTASRTIAIEGAGANGATVTLFDANGNVLPGTEPTVIENNTWAAVAEFPTDAATSQTIVAVQSFDSVVDSTDEVTITLPAAVPASGGGELASTGGTSAGGPIGAAALLVGLGGALIALQKLRRQRVS